MMNWLAVTVTVTVTAAAAVAVLAPCCAQAAVEQDPFYEILETWQDHFKGNFCLTAPRDLYGWTIRLRLRAPVTTLQIPKAQIARHSSDGRRWILRDSGQDGRWPRGERRCLDLIGSRQGLGSDGVRGQAMLIRLPVETDCPAQVEGQQFILTVDSHWETGMSARFCLRVPRAFAGDWKIRLEFDRKGVTGVDVHDAVVDHVGQKRTWLLTPRSHNAALAEGRVFCQGFSVSTRGWLLPCVRAFFTEADGVTPIVVTGPPGTTAPTPTTRPLTTQQPSSQPPTTQPPTTQQPTTQSPSTQPPTTQPPTTQQPTTQSPSTQPPTTQPPTTQQPTTQSPSTQPPTTQPPTTQSPSTQPPTTQPPTTQPPTTQPPTTQPPTTQPPTTQPPTTQPPTTRQPTSQSPPTTQPSTTQPNTTQPPTSRARYDYGDVVSKSLLFYLAQRSGALPDNLVPWRRDSALSDGSDVSRDLTGGWYDAGDYLKLNFPMAASATNLLWGLIAFQEGYSASGQLTRMRKVTRWSLDYFLKCWDADNKVFYGQVGSVGPDHGYWGRPEDMTMTRPAHALTPASPGSDLAAETAAAFAAGYLAFTDTDQPYAAELLRAARSLYDFADTYRGKYSDSITDAANVYRSYGYEDELCWGAAWLYKATGETSYRSKAEAALARGNGMNSQEFSWDDKGLGCVVLLREMETDSLKRQQYAAAINAFTARWRDGNGVSVTRCGLSWLRRWGALRYSQNAAMIALMAAEQGLEAEDNRDWALSQANYALGDNEQGRSYVVGFGVNPPVQPHHASSSCPLAPQPCDWSTFNGPQPNVHVLSGALVGGPDVTGNYADRRQDYVMNEVATDYNAGFQTVLAGLVSLESRGQLPTAKPLCPGSGGSSAGG